jgi:hypothetical protein
MVKVPKGFLIPYDDDDDDEVVTRISFDFTPWPFVIFTLTARVDLTKILLRLLLML